MTIRSTSDKDVNEIYKMIPVKKMEIVEHNAPSTDGEPALTLTRIVNAIPNIPDKVYLGVFPMAVPVMLAIGGITCALCIAVVSGSGIDPNQVPIASPFRFYYQFGGKPVW